MKVYLFFILIGIVFSVSLNSNAQSIIASTDDENAFNELYNGNYDVVFSDDCKGDWTDKWFLDGEVGYVKNTSEGMELHAGPTYKSDADHVVLWTKQDFAGDLLIEYDYTKLDDTEHKVNIIYIQATGSGEGDYKKDITEWNSLRSIPSMSTYYDNMNLLHISYAAITDGTQYIRGRRYRPDVGTGLDGTDIGADEDVTGFFQKDNKHKIIIIKKGFDLYMKVSNSTKTELYKMNYSDHPEIVEGYIGLRQMYTRNSLYSNFIVKSLDGYTLAVNKGSGDGSYDEGASVSISADTPQSGYKFKNWTGDVAKVTNVNSSSTTIIMPAENVTITANYILSNSLSSAYQAEDAILAGEATTESNNAGYNGSGYINFELSGSSAEFQNIDGGTGGNSTLTISWANGKIDRSGSLIINGSSQSLIMEGTTAWDSWSSKDLAITLVAGTNNTIKFESTGEDFGNLDQIIITNTAPIPTYTLNVVKGTGGDSYEAGEAVNISANSPQTGYLFDKWTGDISNVADTNASSTTLIMPAQNISITAIFAVEDSESYTLNVVEGSGDGSYTEGASVDISADPPQSGFVFDKWTGDVSYLSDANSSITTLIMPGQNTSVSAGYKKLDNSAYQLTVVYGDGDGNYYEGQVVDISVQTLPANYLFEKWVGDVAGILDVNSGTTTIKMPSNDVEITAEYNIISAITNVYISNTETQLHNYPNPFSDNTVINFALKEASQVNMVVYNIKGEQVYNIANKHFNIGTHEVILSKNNLKSGMYFLKLRTDYSSNIIRLLIK